jgi:hypothetical protein
MLEDKVDDELLVAKITPMGNIREQRSTKLEILDANVDGLRVDSIAGAEERAAHF